MCFWHKEGALEFVLFYSECQREGSISIAIPRMRMTPIEETLIHILQMETY